MRNKKKNKIFLYLLVILGITVGFAFLSTTLYINGTASIKSNSWNIHWDDTSINVTSGSVSASTPSVTTATSTKDTVSFTINLELPGDFYEFEIDAINEGGIDGALDVITTKIYDSNNQELTGNNIPSYLIYSVKYDDNTDPPVGDILTHGGGTQTYKIRVEYDSRETAPKASDETYTIKINIPYIQHKDDSTGPVDFQTSSWKDITDAYNDDPTVFDQDMADGTLREVPLDFDGDGTTDKTAHIRIANTTKCSNGESASACGLVLEFVETIDEHIMNPWSGSYHPNTNGDGSYGGWEHSEMRTYLNNTVIDYLPSELTSKIIPTSMISSHSYLESNNFTTTGDKLYLFGTREIWEEGSGFDPYFGIKVQDSAYDNERQLDYYRIKGVLAVPSLTTFPEAVKNDLEGHADVWALRSAQSDSNFTFAVVGNDGYYNYSQNANVLVGIAPAFRLAE
jgi:hypothetical protein